MRVCIEKAYARYKQFQNQKKTAQRTNKLEEPLYINLH